MFRFAFPPDCIYFCCCGVPAPPTHWNLGDVYLTPLFASYREEEGAFGMVREVGER